MRVGRLFGRAAALGALLVVMVGTIGGAVALRERVLLQARLEQELWTAVEQGDASRLRVLLARGMSPNVPGYRRQRLVTVASQAQNSRLVGVLLRAGADPSATDRDGFTPLMGAALAGDPRSLRLLLDAGARADATDVWGDTALSRGARSDERERPGVLECIRLLLDKGADINHPSLDGGTPLMSAAWSGNPKICELLLIRGADPMVKDKEGNTALDVSRGGAVVEVLRRVGLREGR